MLKRRTKITFLKTIAAVAAAAFLSSGFYMFLHRDDFKSAENAKGKSTEHEAAVQKQPSKMVPIKIDVEKEKQALKDAGFFVSRKDLPSNTSKGGSGLGEADSLYNFGLKDYVYNMDTILKGKVLGTKSYIDNAIVRTEVKLLVEECLSGTAQPGQIFPFVITGGVITEYDSLKINGNKEHLTAKELEATKNKLVVDDALGTIVYPEDEMYVFVGKDTLTIPSSNEQIPWLNFQIKVTGGKINTITSYEFEDSYFSKELRAMKDVNELQTTLEKLVIEKKDFSQEKARNAALRSLSDSERSSLSDVESARVIFLSQGTYVDGVKSEPNLIKVSFTGKKPITVYLKEATYEVYR